MHELHVMYQLRLVVPNHLQKAPLPNRLARWGQSSSSWGGRGHLHSMGPAWIDELSQRRPPTQKRISRFLKRHAARLRDVIVKDQLCHWKLDPCSPSLAVLVGHDQVLVELSHLPLPFQCMIKVCDTHFSCETAGKKSRSVSAFSTHVSAAGFKFNASSLASPAFCL